MTNVIVVFYTLNQLTILHVSPHSRTYPVATYKSQCALAFQCITVSQWKSINGTRKKGRPIVGRRPRGLEPWAAIRLSALHSTSALYFRRATEFSHISACHCARGTRLRDWSRRHGFCGQMYFD